MRKFRVELVDSITGVRTIAGEYATEGEAALRILQIADYDVIELWNEFSLLARIERKPDEAPQEEYEFRLAAE